MASYAINTAEVLEQLISSGMDETQAKVIVNALAQSNEEIATKGNLDSLESRLKLQIYLMGGIVVALLKALEYLGV